MSLDHYMVRTPLSIILMDLVTSIFLLKNLATLPTAVAVRLSGPLSLIKTKRKYLVVFSFCFLRGRERNFESYRFCTVFIFFQIEKFSKIYSNFSSPLTQAKQLACFAHKNKTAVRGLYFVGERGLEPPCLAALAPKASVSAISPLAHNYDNVAYSKGK